MASVYTLQGPSRRGRRGKAKKAAEGTRCKRTKTGRKLCFFGKSKKAPTGWLFVKE